MSTDADTQEWAPTACILCECNCGIEVQLEGRKLAKIRGDKSHPGSAGYTCNKAMRLDHYQNGKHRLTSPLRLPYNFIKGPIIGWTAPKAFVSDMGFIAMPQLALSSAFAGSAEPDVLIPSGSGPGGSLEIPVEERGLRSVRS